MDLSEYRQVSNYPNYYINRQGEVFSLNRKKFLSPRKSKRGYNYLTLYKNGEPKQLLIHRLVAIEFLKTDPRPVVNHKDGNKLNNTAENLEWMTQKENLYHAWKTGLMSGRVLSERHKKSILGMRKMGAKRKLIAECHGTTMATVGRVVTRYLKLERLRA